MLYKLDKVRPWNSKDGKNCIGKSMGQRLGGKETTLFSDCKTNGKILKEQSKVVLREMLAILNIKHTWTWRQLLEAQTG